MALANTINVQQATGLTGADRSVTSALFHTPHQSAHLPLFLAGGTSTVLASSRSTRCSSDRRGPREILFGVPAIYQAISLSPRFADATDARAHWGCGGAPLPESLIRAFLARACACATHGMTETGPTCS